MTSALRVRLAFAMLIALCAFGAWAGVDERLEGTLHDLAVRAGLYEMRLDEPPPIVVVGIDDNTLEFMSDSTLGREGGQIRWPWPRSVHAAVVDELARLGARTIVFDVMFGDADRPADDRAFADAIARHGGVVLAARLAREGAYDAGVPEPADLRRALDARESAGLGTGEDARALLLVIESGGELTDREAVAIAALAGEDATDLERNRAARLLDTALSWARARESALASRAVGVGDFPGMDDRALFPTPAVARGSAGVGNTDMGGSSGEADAVVRRVPLWVRERDRAYPLLGLAGAMHFAGANGAELDATRTRFGGVLDPAPTATRYTPGFDASVGGMARVRWPRGESEWRTQFDVDGERRFFSVLEVLNLPPLRRRMMESFASVNDEAVFAAAVLGGPVSEERLTELAVAVTEMSPTEGAWEGVAQRVAQAWGGLRDHARAIARDGATRCATPSHAPSVGDISVTATASSVSRSSETGPP
ncbi:MAG: CHASE2 domain-containing protein, partial [Planctomycetota bacterium]